MSHRLAPIGKIWDAAMEDGRDTHVRASWISRDGLWCAKLCPWCSYRVYTAQGDFIDAAASAIGLLLVIVQALVVARGEVAFGWPL